MHISHTASHTQVPCFRSCQCCALSCASSSRSSAVLLCHMVHMVFYSHCAQTLTRTAPQINNAYYCFCNCNSLTHTPVPYSLSCQCCAVAWEISSHTPPQLMNAYPMMLCCATLRCMQVHCFPSCQCCAHSCASSSRSSAVLLCQQRSQQQRSLQSLVSCCRLGVWPLGSCCWSRCSHHTLSTSVACCFRWGGHAWLLRCLLLS
jgi:hypothetical protein